jgi:hypothetical protein
LLDSGLRLCLGSDLVLGQETALGICGRSRRGTKKSKAAKAKQEEKKTNIRSSYYNE